MTLALVFAMTGGAYAAKKYLITSTKQISPSVLKQLVGKTGPAGANGKDGAPGAQGAAGANGKDGAAGAAGETGATGPKGETGATGSAGAKGLNGVNGTNGATGPAGPTGPQGATGEINIKGPLPAGKTETGGWAIGSVEVGDGKPVRTVISFPIPLGEALNEAHTHVANNKKEELIAEKFVPATVCLGTVAEPTAPSGNLCVYFVKVEHTSIPVPFSEKFTSTGFFTQFGASTTGALIVLSAGATAENPEIEPVAGWGSWAVTG